MEPIVTQTTYTGPGFLTLLGLLFVGLKLAGFITWSWWWVLLPFWLPVALVFALVALAAVAFGLYLLVTWVKSRRK